MKLRRGLTWVLFLLPAIGWFFWSFTMTDHSLLYSTNSLFLRFQNFWWQFSQMRLVETVAYLALVSILFAVYARIKSRKLSIPIVLFFLFFIFSNPALSYDLFNYIFDAKLVVHYHLDPHITSAILFSGKDDWVRFMRNTFFPTTYGYVWTGLSLIPYVLGLSKFLSIFIAFKLFMASGLYLLFRVERYVSSKLQRVKADVRGSLALFFFSPLVILESLSSAHNDVWMMLLAFTSLALLFEGNFIVSLKSSPKKIKIVRLIVRLSLSLIFLVASSEVKRSTILLLPIWLVFAAGLIASHLKLSELVRRAFSWFQTCWADLAALLMFAPLFTELSRQFNPWYLVWPLTFLPFMRNRLLRMLLITFSLTSLIRYVPILYSGVYSIQLEQLQRLITWSAIPLGLLCWMLMKIFRPVKKI